MDSDGVLDTDPLATWAFAEDFGRSRRAVPRAVGRPRIPGDVLALIGWARERGVGVAARGAGHGMAGYGLAPDGLIIDMSGLAAVHEIAEDRVVTDAGVLWSDLLTATLAHRRTPPALTDYIGTTVGGTLSVGGVGGMAHRYGMQTDNVLELDVVTGAGELITCSAEREPELFDAVRAGLGQHGIIVRATLRLVPAASAVRMFRLRYPDLRVFLADQRALSTSADFGFLAGYSVFDETGTLRHTIEAACLTDDPDSLDTGGLTDGLASAEVEVSDVGFTEFAHRVQPALDARKDTGDWAGRHPWLNLFLPDSLAAEEIERILTELGPDDLGRSGLLLAYPFRTGNVRTPLVRLPDEPLVWLCALLLSDVRDPVAWRRRNRRIHDRVRAAGGTLYPIGPPALRPDEWPAHYGEAWPSFTRLRERTDPDRILTPGPGM